jgi:hypothetical protein
MNVRKNHKVRDHSGSSDTVNGVFAPGTPIEIGGSPFQVTSGSFVFNYGYNYQNGDYGYYYNSHFNGGGIDLTADPVSLSPEPGTYLTMGTGLLFLLGVCRRKIFQPATF